MHRLEPASTDPAPARRRRRASHVIKLLLAATLMAGYSCGAVADDEASNHVSSGEYRMPPNAGAPPGPDQPLPFSHAQHAGEFRLPCVTCHSGSGSLRSAAADEQAEADLSLPPTSTCMNCHQAVATDRPAIQSLAQYHSTGEAVPWVRVYELLAGVNWSHRPHIDAGVACETCHGEVTALEVMSVQKPVTAMGTCLGCHQASGANSECVTCHAWPTDATFETRLTDR